MATRQLVDPSGVHWRVRRRWYPWRRALPLRDTWHGTPATEPEPQPESGSDTESDSGSDSELPRNVVVRALLLVLAGLVWLAWSIGKVLVYAVAALLFVAASLVELACQLALMPFVLLLRLCGAARWPVEIARQGKHFSTEYAPDLARAAALQEHLATSIEAGTPPEAPVAAA